MACRRTFFSEHPNLAKGGGGDADVVIESDSEVEIEVDGPSSVANAAAPAAAPIQQVQQAPAPEPTMVPVVTPARAPVGRVVIAIDLAQQAEEAGQIDRAIEAWKGVLRLDSSVRQAREALTRLYSNAGRWNNLVEMLRQELEGLGGAEARPRGSGAQGTQARGPARNGGHLPRQDVARADGRADLQLDPGHRARRSRLADRARKELREAWAALRRDQGARATS